MLTIDIFIDVICPWCFIGTERLENVLATLPLPVDPAITYHPFLLDPSIPPEGRDIQAWLRAKYGRDPREVFAVAEAQAQESGIALDLSKQPYAYRTLAAHTLLRHAQEKGTHRRFARALFHAYFIDALNIDDAVVLASIAQTCGFDAATAQSIASDPSELAVTRQEIDQAAENGIRGVPFFIFNDRVAVSGAQPEAAFRAAIQEALKTRPQAPVPA